MPRRVLISGGAGFVGQWVARALLERDWAVYAGTLDGPPGVTVLTDVEKRSVCWTALDVLSDESISRALHSSVPEWVVHLAGIASPREANAHALRTFDINALGTFRLLTQLAPAGSSAPRTLVVGSAEQYGAQDASAYPIPETAVLRPLTPYATSKAAQELIALQIFRSTGLHVVCTRSFNHSGAGHGSDYLIPSLVRRVGELPKQGGTLRLGNDAVVRDYTHVADVVEAYVGLLEKGHAGEVYNVCSGTGTPVRELAERVLKRAGVTADISTDATLLRPIDVPILVGDNSKLRRTTGWAPKRSIDDIIDDLIHAASR